MGRMVHGQYGFRNEEKLVDKSESNLRRPANKSKNNDTTETERGTVNKKCDAAAFMNQ